MSELGQALKEAREQKGLSLDDLQERTKIQKRYLKAIEDGDFKQLPGDFYIRAFIKSYAETVGLDFSTLIQQYGSEIPTLHHDQPEIRTLPPSGAESARSTRKKRSGSGEGGRSVRLASFINRALVIVIVLIILMVAYLLITGVMSNRGNNGAAGGPNSGSSVSFSGSSSSISSASSDSGSKAGSSSSSEQQVLKKDSTQGTTTTYTLTGTQKFDVVVSLKNGPKAWFEASDAKTGKVIKQGVVLAAGPKSIHFNAAHVPSLKLTFGAVPYTQLKINGQNFTFPNSSTVQHIVINYSK